MKNSKLKQAINKALAVYYKKGLTSTANRFKLDLFTLIDRYSKSKKPRYNK